MFISIADTAWTLWSKIKAAVELKSIDKILPIHQAQLMTYLHLSKMRVGLLINFNVRVLRDGIVRRIL